jgi:putative membrane protein
MNTIARIGPFAAVTAGAMALAFAGNGEDADDAKFLDEAIRGNVAEVRMGELAQQRGQSEGVREYGEMLEDDHSKAMEKTAALAESIGVAAPTEPTTEQEQHFDALSTLSGAEFDAVFVSHMVVAHQEEIATYSKHATSDNPKVAALAEEVLPTLREHLVTAQSLQRGSAPRSGG